jgi:hypothetical protein
VNVQGGSDECQFAPVGPAQAKQHTSNRLVEPLKLDQLPQQAIGPIPATNQIGSGKPPGYSQHHDRSRRAPSSWSFAMFASHKPRPVDRMTGNANSLARVSLVWMGLAGKKTETHAGEQGAGISNQVGCESFPKSLNRGYHDAVTRRHRPLARPINASCRPRRKALLGTDRSEERNVSGVLPAQQNCLLGP